MKLRYLAATCALTIAAAGSIQAQKTADQLRIYINPGHGSWTANDRPMSTIDRAPYADPDNVDTTGFFETNTNIQKCLFLLYKLNDMGIPFDPTKNQTNENPARVGAALDLSQNLVMSHVKAGPYPTVKMGADPALADAYNRSLSEISAEVDANNFDMFISVHSNAHSDGSTTNYPLYLFRGADGEPQVAGSDEMAKACWAYSYENVHMDWSYYSMTNMNIRGDWSFYGSHSANAAGYDGYLGALKHGAAGFLVEGYFHTYQPARYRAMNDDVCHIEGLAYARGICDYFGLKKETTGYVYGIVRDKHEKFKHDLYNAITTSNSLYKPLNGATVTLKKGDAVVATYTTDKEYNGAFVFKNVEPGTYTLSYSHPNYKEADAEYTAPFEVKANATAYVAAFLESTAYEPPAVNYVDYPDEINTPGIRAASSYNFTSVYADAAIEALAGKTVRRAILKGENLFVLALDAENAPYVYVINTKTQVATAVSTNGTAGSELALADIAVTADGVLVGCSRGTNSYNGSATINVYKWAQDAETTLPTGDPAVWYTSNKSGNFNNSHTGNTMYYKGTLKDGLVVISAETTGSAGKVRFDYNAIADGEKISSSFARIDLFTMPEYGADYQVSLSPRDLGYMVVTGSNAMPHELLMSNTEKDRKNIPAGLLNVAPAKVGLFKYAGHSFMVAPDVVDGVNVVKIIDFTDGMDKAKLVKVSLEGAMSAQSIVAAAGRTVVTMDDLGENVVDAQIELLSLNNAGALSQITTAGVEQPKVYSAYAYDLTSTNGEGTATFNFKLNTNAAAARVLLYAAGEETPSASFDVPAPSKGENELTVSTADLTFEGRYTWAVEVTSEAIPTGQVAFKAVDVKSSTGRGGVAVDTDPASPTFGTAYVSHSYAEGIQQYDPLFEETARYAPSFNSGSGSSPMRMALSEGKLYLVDWCDPHGGIWMFNPATPDADITCVFEGTRESSGRVVNNGVAVGGSSTGVDFLGTGDSRQMFAFVEDYPTGNNGNKLVRYDLGTADTWGTAPSKTFDDASRYMVNTNVEVTAIEEGLFISQVRTNGQNVKGVPSFLFVDHEGTVSFNSATLSATLGGSQGAGLAISKDKKLLVVGDQNANLQAYSVEWTDGVPALTYLYTVVLPGTNELNQLRFDYAGNVYAYNRKSGLYVIALPGDAAVTTTPAPAEQVISGVEEVEAEAALVVYPNPAETVVNVRAGEDINSILLFNLAGSIATSDVTVDGNSATVNVEGLPAGTYILKVNDKTAKVIKK